MVLAWVLSCATQLDLELQGRQRVLGGQKEQESSRRRRWEAFIPGAIRSRNQVEATNTRRRRWATTCERGPAKDAILLHNPSWGCSRSLLRPVGGFV
jgi:hypothetical protein